MGKSVFSAFLMSRLQSKIRLLGGVFFMFNKAEVSNPYTMMLTLAFQIATVFPELQDIILKTYNEISRSSELDVQLVLEKLIPIHELFSVKLPTTHKHGLIFTQHQAEFNLLIC